MGFFGKLISATVNIAVLPIEVVKDVATLGGVLTDQDDPYTYKRLEKTTEKISEAVEELTEL